MLRALGLGGATVLVTGTGVVTYRAYDNGVLDAGSGTPYDAWSHVRDDPGPMGTVAAAILAANPHDTQPWTFRVTSSGVDVHTDPSRGIGSIDPFDREKQTGLGCALENLVLAAAVRGLQPRVTILPSPADPTLVATVALSAGGSPATMPLYEVIGDRHTNRGPYSGDPVHQSLLDELTADTDPSTAAVRWFTTPSEIAALGALIIDATRAIVADEQQSIDGFAWFRNNRDDIVAHMDGLTLDAQGLGPVTLALAKLLPTSSRRAGDQFWLTQTITVHTRTAAAYGVVTVPDPHDPAQRLVGGRLLQHVHLAATARGLGLQHMNQVTERSDRERMTGAPATFAPRLDRLLVRPGRRPLVAFRVGYPVRTARPSPRRPLSAVTR